MINQKIRKIYFCSIKRKINFENKKRNKIFSIINNKLNLISFFDYFSLEAFKLILFINYFLNNNKRVLVKKSNLDIITLLAENNILNLTNFSNLLNASIYNSFIKFKSPIITSDIILFTFLDQSNKDTISNLNLNLFKYKLLQKIFISNSFFRKFKKNSQLFVLLFQTQLSDKEIKRLTKFKDLKSIIFLFRNILINKVKIETDKIYNKNPISKYIFITNSRKY